MGQWLLWKYSLWRNRNSGNLPQSLVPLFKVEEGVGEVDDILMAVDVGHGGKNRVEGEVRVEEYRRKTMKTTKAKPQVYIYIKYWPSIKSPISIGSF